MRQCFLGHNETVFFLHHKIFDNLNLRNFVAMMALCGHRLLKRSLPSNGSRERTSNIELIEKCTELVFCLAWTTVCLSFKSPEIA